MPKALYCVMLTIMTPGNNSVYVCYNVIETGCWFFKERLHSHGMQG